MNLAKTLKERRKELGISQMDLARRANMSQGAYSKIESGDLIPTLPYAARIAKVLRLSLDELTELKPKSPSKLEDKISEFFKYMETKSVRNSVALAKSFEKGDKQKTRDRRLIHNEYVLILKRLKRIFC